jgi:phosphoribosylamine---glycine ligase
MNLMIVGSGAREHAIVWRMAADPAVTSIVAVPGNPGIARLARCLPGDPGNPQSLAQIARHEGIDFTIVGPELPLCRGIANLFAAEGLPLLGPTAEAAQLESSKAFAKDFMARHSIPTARYELCDTPVDAYAAVRSKGFGFPVVLKADGLAAGKGVVVAHDLAEADKAIVDLMVDRRYGDAGKRVVVEECLAGREASFFVLCDGSNAIPIASAEDHKRAFDGDRGPNTGGMGSFAPSPLFDERLQSALMGEIVRPVVEGLLAEGRQYRGFLYVGLMVTTQGPKVIEFNVRLGDPEAQVVLPLIDGELLPLLFDSAEGRLSPSSSCRLRDGAAVGVVLASGGYPGKFEAGKHIDGLDTAERLPDVLVFHAGTAVRDGSLVTAGGRVLTVVGRGTSHREAMRLAYRAVETIDFRGMHVRSDIGARAVHSHAKS